MHVTRDAYICACRETRSCAHAAKRVHFCMPRNAFICACRETRHARRKTRSLLHAVKRVHLRSFVHVVFFHVAKRIFDAFFPRAKSGPSLCESFLCSRVGTREQTQSLRGDYPGRLQSVARRRCAAMLTRKSFRCNSIWGEMGGFCRERRRCGGAVRRRGAVARCSGAVRWRGAVARCGGGAVARHAGEMGNSWPRVVAARWRGACGGDGELWPRAAAVRRWCGGAVRRWCGAVAVRRWCGGAVACFTPSWPSRESPVWLCGSQITLRSSAPVARDAPTYRCFTEKCGFSTSQSHTLPGSVRPWHEAYVIAWQSRVCRSSSAGVKLCPSSSQIRSPTSRTAAKQPLATLPPAPNEPQSRPHTHRLRLVGARGPLRPVLHQQRSLRREPPVLPLIDGHPVGVGDDEAGVGVAPPREQLPHRLHGLPQRRLLRLVHAKPPQEAEDRLVAALVLRERVHAAACQVVQQLRARSGPRARCAAPSGPPSAPPGPGSARCSASSR